MLEVGTILSLNGGMKQSPAKTRTIKRSVITRVKPEGNSTELKEGQLWKMEDVQMEIMHVGKHLAHYKLHKQHKRVPTHLEGIGRIQEYLKEHGARLVRNGGLTKPNRVLGRGVYFGKK
jgi:peptidoglycan/xylan/chitin deacetylase (PgdA/CDA1 family)